MGDFRKWVIGMCLALMVGCASGKDAVTVTTVSPADAQKGLSETAARQLSEIQKSGRAQGQGDDIFREIQQTPNYSVEEYRRQHDVGSTGAAGDYRVGGRDVLDIIVYEEPDLTVKGVRVSNEGVISFPLAGRLKVDNRTTSQIESLIAKALADGQFVRDAHVSVTVSEYKSKQFMVLGAVKTPGTFPLKVQERVLDAVSIAGGIDFEKAGSRAMIIRSEHPGMPDARKAVIRIDLQGLLKGVDPESNLLLADKDQLYVPAAEPFFIIGQVAKPGSYLCRENPVTLVEAISMAGGFTRIASPNRTRIIRKEGGAEKIIEVRVDQITDSGKKDQDVIIKPGDIIVIPESIF